MNYDSPVIFLLTDRISANILVSDGTADPSFRKLECPDFSPAGGGAAGKEFAAARAG
jgi:hypothetical protein